MLPGTNVLVLWTIHVSGGTCHCNSLICQARFDGRRFRTVLTVELVDLWYSTGSYDASTVCCMLDQSNPDDAVSPPCAPVPALRRRLILACTDMLHRGCRVFRCWSLGRRGRQPDDRSTDQCRTVVDVAPASFTAYLGSWSTTRPRRCASRNHALHGQRWRWARAQGGPRRRS